MCLAIGPMQPPERGLYSRYWWAIAHVPDKLFLFSSVVHGGLLWLLHLLGLVDYAQYPVLLSSLIFYALLGFSLLGVLLHFLPQWLHTSSIDYGVYGSCYNLVFIGLLLLELGLLFSEWMILPAMLLLILSWLLAANSLRWCFKWTLRGNAQWHRLILLLLYLAPLSLLFNMVCMGFSSCFVSATQIFYKDLLIMALLLLAFVALFVGRFLLKYL